MAIQQSKPKSQGKLQLAKKILKILNYYWTDKVNFPEKNRGMLKIIQILMKAKSKGQYKNRYSYFWAETWTRNLYCIDISRIGRNGKIAYLGKKKKLSEVSNLDSNIWKKSRKKCVLNGEWHNAPGDNGTFLWCLIWQDTTTHFSMETNSIWRKEINALSNYCSRPTQYIYFRRQMIFPEKDICRL